MCPRIWDNLLLLEVLKVYSLGTSTVWAKIWTVNGLLCERVLRMNRTFKRRMIGAKLATRTGDLMESLAYLKSFF